MQDLTWKVLCLSFLTLLFPGMSQARAERPRPNIVVILADDIGFGDLGCYGGEISTPNIDSLAEYGMRFTDAHTPSSVCAPTRYAVLTGNNPYRNGDRQGTWSDKEPSAFYINDNAATPSKTIAQVLGDAGYKTAFYGKMHLGKAALKSHGFDEALGLLRGIQGSPYFFVNADGSFEPINPDQPEKKTWNSGTYPNPDGSITRIPKTGIGDVNYDATRVGDILSQQACEFISGQAANDIPFFVYYATQAIHSPHCPPAIFDGHKVLGETGYRNRGDMIHEMDLQVGRIINAVADSGQLENTLFVFTSDNGGFKESTESSKGGPTHFHNAGLRGQKGTSYEAGHRVPFIVRWGDGTNETSVIKPNSTTDALASVNDLAASFYDLTGQSMEANQAMDSVSLLPILVGHSTDVRDSMYLQQNNDHDSPHIGWRSDDSTGEWVLLVDGLMKSWKLKKTLKPLELYNLSSDRGQANNLINDSSHDVRIPRMLRDLRKYAQSFDSPRSTPVIDYSQMENQTPLPTPGLGTSELNKDEGVIELTARPRSKKRDGE